MISEVTHMSSIQTGLSPRASANSSSQTVSAQKTASTQLAESLQIDPADVTVTSIKTRRMNLSTLGFPEAGALQMSAAGEVSEVKMCAGDEKFVFRGTASIGSLGIDVEHQGYWEKDERGIYTPSESRDRGDSYEGDPFTHVGTLDDQSLVLRPPARVGPAPVAAEPQRTIGMQGEPRLPQSDINGVKLSEKQLNDAETVARELANKLDVTADKVEVGSYKETMMSATFGFSVAGELQMSGLFDGSEMKLSVGDESFIYRGHDGSGRYGLDTEHKGSWTQDERGIYTPSESGGRYSDIDEDDPFSFVGTLQ